MAMRPLSYPEVSYSNTFFMSMQSSRIDPYGTQSLSGINLTYLDFLTAYLQPRIFVIYCPYGGFTPTPSEPWKPYPQVANYAHRIESIYDASVGQTGGPGYWTSNHWAAGWHVFLEYWDAVLDFGNYRSFLFNGPEPAPAWVDYAVAYFSPMNVNKGGTGYKSVPSVGSSTTVQPPVQGINGRQNTSPGGAWNEAGVTSATRGVENDTTLAREFFFIANFLFDPSGANPSPNYNPQSGIHNLVSDVSPAFTHVLTVKPRYLNGQDFEPDPALRGQPMPHGVVMSVWVREIKDIGQAPFRERVVQPIQSPYNSSTFSLVIKGGNFGPAHVQAF
jgi:hypothetical protein